MKSAAEMEDRVRELLRAELRRRLTRDVLPGLCVHNHRHHLDHRKMLYGEQNDMYNRVSERATDGHVALPVAQTIGLCMLGAETIETWPGNICEEPLDAQRCPYFAYKAARADIYKAFIADVSSRAWVEESLPAVDSLLWAVGSSLKVDNSTGLKRLWARFWGMLVRRGKKELAEVSVYLPTLDAFPDEDRTRTPAGY